MGKSIRQISNRKGTAGTRVIVNDGAPTPSYKIQVPPRATSGSVVKQKTPQTKITKQTQQSK